MNKKNLLLIFINGKNKKHDHRCHQMTNDFQLQLQLQLQLQFHCQIFISHSYLRIKCIDFNH